MDGDEVDGEDGNNDKHTQSNQETEQACNYIVEGDANGGMEVNSLEVVGDDCFPNDMLGVENEIIILKVGMKFDSLNDLFEFRGVICKHTISILLRCEVSLLPEKYILRRWRKDVSRPYMRVAPTYNGLVRTPEQLRYEQLCTALTKMANLVAPDEERSRQLMGWIELQTKELLNPKSNRLASHGIGGGNVKDVNIFDPKCTKRKGAPKKLRIKSSLETTKKKSRGRNKVMLNSASCNRPTLSNDNVSNNLPMSQVMSISSRPPPQAFGTQDGMEAITNLH